VAFDWYLLAVSIFLRLDRRSGEAIPAASPRCTAAAFTQGLT
jgi:hypothetical protein